VGDAVGDDAKPPAPAIVLAAMRLEKLALGGAVVRIGMGHQRALAATERLAPTLTAGSPVVLAGISGGLDPDLRPGELVVATSVRGPDGDETLLAHADAEAVAGALRAVGRSVHLGPVVSSRTLVHGERRAALARSGALAVDMESAWVAAALRGMRLVVVRVVADTAGNVVVGLVKGLAALRGVGRALEGWPAPDDPGRRRA
jgi:4-hydroxy-3-methylbut-2-enyl diphosphate reductase